MFITYCIIKTLEFNWYQKSDKAPFNVYADLEYSIKKIDRSKNNTENTSTAKAVEHIPSGFSMSTISPFKSTENKHDVYRGKDLKDWLILKRKKEQPESYENANLLYL